MERVLITGVNGLLGQKCVEQFAADFLITGIDVHNDVFSDEKQLQYHKVDITKRNDVKKIILSSEPHYIINTAAYTDVDGCESKKEICWKVNVEGVQNMVYAAGKIKAKIIHISTDYVFDGTAGPYKESDKPAPLGYYGKAKLASENVLRQSTLDYAIIRTMILYGAGINIRPNFVTWLIKKLQNNDTIRIVTDQVGNPTLADDLARSIRKIIELKKWDTFHIAGNDLLDRYIFALKIASIFKLNQELITPITTADLGQAAPRPLKSGFVLDKIKQELDLLMFGVDESLNILKKQLKKIKFI